MVKGRIKPHLGLPVPHRRACHAAARQSTHTAPGPCRNRFTRWTGSEPTRIWIAVGETVILLHPPLPLVGVPNSDGERASAK